MMNFGEIKSFLKGTSLFDVNQKNGPNANANAAAQRAKPNAAMPSTTASIVERSQSNVLSFNILNKVVNEKLASLDPNGAAAAKAQQDNESLFDFEEVAKNVLSFVEQAVMKAKGNGANDEKLTEMMGKARQGIEDGFSMAREELSSLGQDSDEVNEGIDKSYEAIQTGLEQFEHKLFGTGEASDLSAMGVMSASEVNYSLSKSSSLAIKTNDGDTVTIDFAQALAYQRSEMSGAYATENEDGSTTGVAYNKTTESYYQATGFSFSVEGDLDEDEKAAIGSLVQNVSKLADEFFNGDLDKAFEQATQLGFDENELSGFALKMTRTETVSVAQAYSQVARYEDNERPTGGYGESGQSDQVGRPNMAQLMKPIGSYLKELVSFLEQAQEKLQDGNDLQSLVNESVSQYLDFAGEQDMGGALERFAAFNQRMLGLLDPGNPDQAGTPEPDLQTDNPPTGESPQV